MTDIVYDDSIVTDPGVSLTDIMNLLMSNLFVHSKIRPDTYIFNTLGDDIKDHHLSSNVVPSAVQSLINYGFVTQDDDGDIAITDDGRLIQPLSIGYRAAAGVCEAYRMGMLSEMLPLIAMLEIGDARHLQRDPMRGAHWTTSDPVMQLMTLVQYFYVNGSTSTREQMRERAEMYNVSLRKYGELLNLVRDLEEQTNYRADWHGYLAIEDEALRAKVDKLTKQVIFRAMSGDAYPAREILSEIAIPSTQVGDQTLSIAQLSRNTSCSAYSRFSFATGMIKPIVPKQNKPFVTVDFVTMFTDKDLPFLVERFGKERLQQIANLSTESTELNDYLNGKDASTTDTQVPTDEPTPKVGLFGALLQEALSKQK